MTTLPRAASLLLVSALLLSACQTRPPADPDTQDRVPASAPLIFRPALAEARLVLGEGHYPTLFAPASRAVWTEPGASPPAPTSATQQPASAQATIKLDENDPAQLTGVVAAPVDDRVRMMAANFRVIECYLESAFADSSIAYDAVGLRNVQAYLELPDGQRIDPAQKIMDSNLLETPVGALRRYQRKNILVFPATPITVATPVPGTPSPGVRLVLEGHGSKFYFEWPAALPSAIGALPISKQEWVQDTKGAYHTVRQKQRAILHKFD